MSGLELAAPWALWALLGLPLLLLASWLGARPRTVRVASLQLWRKLALADPDRSARRRQPRWLELALAAATLVAATLAAAGPRWQRAATDGRLLVLVVDASSRMRTRLPDGDTAWERARQRIAVELDRLGPRDLVRLWPLPARAGSDAAAGGATTDGWQTPAQARTALASLAPEGLADDGQQAEAVRAALALPGAPEVALIARRPVASLPTHVRRVAVGPRASRNAGWIGIEGAAAPGDNSPQVLWVLAGSAAERSRTATVSVDPPPPGAPAERALALPAATTGRLGRAALTLRYEAAAAPERIALTLWVDGDPLPADDALTAIRRPPLSVALEGELGPLRTRLTRLLALLPEARLASGPRPDVVVHLGGDVPPPRSGGDAPPAPRARWLLFPRTYAGGGERVALSAPTYPGRVAGDLLARLDLTGVAVEATWRAPAALGRLRPMAWSPRAVDGQEPRALLLDGQGPDGAPWTVIAFDPTAWSADPTFALVVRRLLARVDPDAGRYVAASPIAGAALTDDRGAPPEPRDETPPAGREPPPEAARALAAAPPMELRPGLALIGVLFLLGYIGVRGTRFRSS